MFFVLCDIINLQRVCANILKTLVLSPVFLFITKGGYKFVGLYLLLLAHFITF